MKREKRAKMAIRRLEAFSYCAQYVCCYSSAVNISNCGTWRRFLVLCTYDTDQSIANSLVLFLNTSTRNESWKDTCDKRMLSVVHLLLTV